MQPILTDSHMKVRKKEKEKGGEIECLVFQFFDSLSYAFQLVLEVALVFFKPFDSFFFR